MCPYARRVAETAAASTIEKIRVDLEPGRRDEMVARPGWRTVPQILHRRHPRRRVLTTHAALDRAGRLVPLLNG